MFKGNSLASRETGIKSPTMFWKILPYYRVLNSAHKLPKCVYFKYSTT